VVLIIAIIGVSMLGFVPGMSSDEQSASSATYWQSTAAPIGIKTATYAPGTVCGSANKGGYLMVVQNKNPESVVLKGMDIDGQSAQFCEPGASTPASEIYISSGYDKPIIVMTSTATTPSGTAVENTVRFKYSKTPLGPVYVEEGTAALCTANSVCGSGGVNYSNFGFEYIENGATKTQIAPVPFTINC